MMMKAFVRLAVLALATALLASNAMAQESLFRSGIAGSNPNTPIAGVPSGGAPWTVQRGLAVLNDNGQLRVEVRDLILLNLGNPGRVTNVSASLVCGGTGGTVVATTGPVVLSSDGNAEIEAKISIPSPCFAPVVLIRAAGFGGTLLPQPGPWIAATGIVDAPESKPEDN